MWGFVGWFKPSWDCSFDRDNGRGKILEEVPEGAAGGHTPRVTLERESSFPPRNRCQVSVNDGEEVDGAFAGRRVVAEAVYPNTLELVLAALVSLLPFCGVVLWQATRPPDYVVPIR
jgi:hypothetical protein